MRALLHFGLPVTAFVVFAAGCNGTGSDTSRAFAGGDLTVFDRSSAAFGFPAPNLSGDELALHVRGDGAFEANFVTAPAPVHSGLGPLFNHISCAGCHVGDGRGEARTGGPPGYSPLLIRVSLPSGDPEVPGGPVPVPGLGTQIEDHAVYGSTPEADVTITWQTTTGTYGDGAPYELRAPIPTIVTAAGQPLPANVLVSPRVAAPIIGLGLLQAVPETTLWALADPEDRDGDGISGRPNFVYDPVSGETVIGRFGWKANVATLLAQTAGAYDADMGVTNPVSPGDGAPGDLSEDTLEATAFYVRTLGVPAPVPDPGDDARRGMALFESFGCAGCHVPTLQTGDDAVPALRGQTIHPYTDLLLHDMGPGLADGRPDFQASGTEWRTAPLWGIGLTTTVLPSATYLHDGRARTLAEAILWHGGEAQASRERFRTAPATDRAALIAFLKSL